MRIYGFMTSDSKEQWQYKEIYFSIIYLPYEGPFLVNFVVSCNFVYLTINVDWLKMSESEHIKIVIGLCDALIWIDISRKQHLFRIVLIHIDTLI
jgi:hypothetical protein